MASERDIRSWYKQVDGTTYLCSSDPALMQLGALNAALGSDELWWATPLPEPTLEKMIDSCLNISLYVLEPESPDQPRERAPRTLVGNGRVITDWVSIGYLTDVYVLGAHQRKGLASWMMKCLNEIVSDWECLRGLLILATGEETAGLYGKQLDAADFFEKNKGTKLKLLRRGGPHEKTAGNPH